MTSPVIAGRISFIALPDCDLKVLTVAALDALKDAQAVVVDPALVEVVAAVATVTEVLSDQPADLVKAAISAAKEGKEVVLTPEQLELATEIGKDFPIIQIVSDQYSEYNNAILDYAVQTGILSEEITINQLIENISSNQKVKITKNDLTNLAKEARKNEFTFLIFFQS